MKRNMRDRVFAQHMLACTGNHAQFMNSNRQNSVHELLDAILLTYSPVLKRQISKTFGNKGLTLGQLARNMSHELPLRILYRLVTSIYDALTPGQGHYNIFHNFTVHKTTDFVDQICTIRQ